ncbi:MAG: DUF4199 domain-containing protein [Saprospiraceae bacterium]|nr:DUF4199 domain-containing protein [Saprospiraceae bacterium]
MNTIWIKYGFTLGVIIIVLQLLIYYFLDINMLLFSVGYYSLLFIIMILAGMQHRKTNNQTLTYGESFKTTLLTGALGTLIGNIMMMVLVNFIDPGLVEVILEKSISSVQSLILAFGGPEVGVSEAIEKIEEELPKQLTIAGHIKSFFSVLIFVVVMAAVVSVFVRKEKTMN